MHSTSIASAESFAGVTHTPARAEAWFRRGLRVVACLAAVTIALSMGMMLWAQNELAPAESVVAAHSLMLAHDGALYYGLRDYPYTVSAYMPLFYVLEAGLIRLGLPAFAAGRLLSFMAFLGLIALAARTVKLYTEDALHPWMAGIAVGLSPVLLYWGAVGQVDVLALLFSAAAFYRFSRFHVLGERTLWSAGAFVTLALMTKQTAVAAPAAMTLALALADWRRAVRFALGVGVPLAAAIWGLDATTDGRFLRNTVFANMNPMEMGKLMAQLQYFGGVCGGLLVIALAALPKLRGRVLVPALYLVAASVVFLITAPKVGSDTNYQLEISYALALCAAVGLQRLDFLHLHFAGSKSWVTLLILPLGVHVAVGARMAANVAMARYANEQVFRAEIEALRPFVSRDDRVISTDFNAMVRLRERMDVEPLIYGLLVEAGQVDPEPVRRDLERRAIPTVILHENVFRPASETNAEIASLPSGQIRALRDGYRLMAHVPGPFLDGVFVYQPR